MADRPPSPETTYRTDVAPAPRPATPRWVKVFAVIAAAVIVVFLVLLLSGGDHGPGRHSRPSGGERHTPGPGVRTP
jgi:hypothetical protein